MTNNTIKKVLETQRNDALGIINDLMTDYNNSETLNIAKQAIGFEVERQQAIVAQKQSALESFTIIDQSLIEIKSRGFKTDSDRDAWKRLESEFHELVAKDVY